MPPKVIRDSDFHGGNFKYADKYNVVLGHVTAKQITGSTVARRWPNLNCTTTYVATLSS